MIPGKIPIIIEMREKYRNIYDIHDLLNNHIIFVRDF